MEPLKVEPPEIVEETEGQNKSLMKTENLLEIVKKLLKEGSLEPQIKDLITRINEFQQAKKSSKEQQKARALWETLSLELDSLNEEKEHLEDILSKKKEALRTLQLHCQRRRKAQRLSGEEHPEHLKSQHKELWEFHILRRRLTGEIPELQSSLEQLCTQEDLARARLQELEQQLRTQPEVEKAPSENAGLKTELEIFGAQGPSSLQNFLESVGDSDVESLQTDPKLPEDRTEKDEEHKKEHMEAWTEQSQESVC